MVKVFIVTGGTGGHIFPAIEVRDFLENMKIKTYLIISPKAHFNKKIAYDYKFDSAPLELKNITHFLYNLYKILKSTVFAFYLILKLRPNFIFVFGSYASSPFFVPSLITGKKIFVFEQNSIPGLITRFFSKFAHRIFISFRETEKFLKKKCIFLGNPIRELKEIPKEEARKILRIPENKETVLFLGGSQGAKKLIELSYLYSKLKDGTVLVMAGKLFDEYREKLKGENFFLFPFRDDIEIFYSASDIVVSRAGSGAVFEILKLKKKAIFIPYPYAKDNHQYYNALFAKNYGTLKVIEEEKIDPNTLKNEIEDLLKKKDEFKELPNWKEVLKKELKICFSSIPE
ncbi:MAG: UDP-N-acetylglucosamine--N-acetylmuramyl-(pentapeptide) pyrophosphoryl-undecaprenol N-acetylglucosamine transferase [Candidatus Hydrothermales bacterium]